MDYSKLNDDYLVVDIVVVDESTMNNEQCIEFLQNLTGHPRWSRRESADFKNTGDIGYQFSNEHNGFIEPQPFHSWLLDLESLTWTPPIPEPIKDGFAHWWDEDSLVWVEELITGE